MVKDFARSFSVSYSAVVYRKGGYVLYMLRQLMFDNKDGDRPFIEMMKDFVATYRNGNASSEDFQRIAEKHIRPKMNLKGDGKLDWFFSEWFTALRCRNISSTIP